MIKKSLRAYISRSQLVLFVLTDGEVVGLLCLQRVKHQVHGVFELLVILPDLHCIDELDEGGEILFLHRGFVVDVPDEGTVQKLFPRFTMDAMIISSFAKFIIAVLYLKQESITQTQVQFD